MTRHEPVEGGLQRLYIDVPEERQLGTPGGREARAVPVRGDESSLDAWFPDLEYDPNRTDSLMCFWITDFNADLLNPGSVRRMYVCIDPDTGAIIPQSIEQEHNPIVGNDAHR